MDEMPFKVGDEIESKSFMVGYRAWFRAKIKKTRLLAGNLSYFLEFFDYPGEKDKWTRVYQKMPHGDGKSEVMVRPSFPAFYRENHLPGSFPTCDVAAIVADDWQVGELVDWCCNDCYWAGTVTKILGDGKVEVHLLEPPIGEGGFYEAEYKDLRPTLDWSLENGWTVPAQKDYGSIGSLVRLVHPNNQGRGLSSELEKVTRVVSGAGFGIPTTKDLDEAENNLSGPSSCPKAMKDASVVREKVSGDVSGAGLGIPSAKDLPTSLDYLEEVWISERNYWSTTRHSCTLGSAIIELEELSLKINWLKDISKLGWSNATKPSWKFLVMDASLEQ